MSTPAPVISRVRRWREGETAAWREQPVIDMHAHVLPCVDDGPGTWDESVAMCRQAVEDGTSILVATPHITPGVYANDGATIAAAVALLRARISRAGLRLSIVPSAEVWLDRTLLLEGDALIPFLGDRAGRRFVLLHVPSRVALESVAQLVGTLASRGVTAIVSQPERHRRFQDQPEALRDLVGAGALSQVTAASLVGKFGRSAAAAARRFLELGLVHVIASAAHSSDHRPPVLSAGVAAAAQVVGPRQARALVSDAPATILSGRLPELEVTRRGLLARLLEGVSQA
jgi:protein-tyrosine phosphatase